MLQVIFETVLGELAFDAVSRTAHTGSVRASALDHETFDHAMEDQTIIEAFFDKTDKIVYCIWCDFRIKLCFHYITIFHGNGYDRVCICHNHSLLLQKVLFFSVGSIIICKEQFCKEKGDW